MSAAWAARYGGSVHRTLLAPALVLFLVACAIPEARMGTADRLQIFGDEMRFPDMGLPADWFADGISTAHLRRRHFDIARDDGALVATLTPAARSYTSGRRVFAPLSPGLQLSWRWNLREPEPGGHPMRLAVGFHGGAPGSVSRGGQPFDFLGTEIPVHDRLILLVWAEKFDARGKLDAGRPVPRYAVRGGDADSGGWIDEAIDLVELYRRTWPKDDAKRAAVTFVAFSAAAFVDEHDSDANSGKFAEIVLSR